MDINITVQAYKGDRNIAEAELPEDVIEQLRDSFPSVNEIKKFIETMMPIVSDADRFAFTLWFKNLNKEE